MAERGVIVIGAGPAGLSTALALKDAGVPSLVLDRGDKVGSSWRSRYDRLRLNSPRPLSHLPSRRFPKGTPMFPSRDEEIAHLESNAREDGVDIRFGTNVEHIDHDGNDWTAQMSDEAIAAKQMVVATGFENEPVVPKWRGLDEFEGEVLHSARYKNPKPFQGKKVLVVGPGCSGMEIAYDVATGDAAKVWLSVRTPPNIVLRQSPGPLPGDFIALALLRLPERMGDAAARLGRRMDLGDLSQYGLPEPDEGIFTRLNRDGIAPAIVDKEVIAAIKSGKIEVVRGVESLNAKRVDLADGADVHPDVVICATGYKRSLEPLVGHLAVLDDRGIPRTFGAKPTLPGLRFVGFKPRPAALGYMAKEGQQAAKAIVRDLR